MKAIAWNIAKSPGSLVTMYFLLLVLIPNSPSIYVISFTSLALWNPIRSILNVNASFHGVRSPELSGTLLRYKAVYVLFNLFFVVLGAYKIAMLGFLPIYSADWINYYTVPVRAEHSSGGIPLVSSS